MGWTSELYTVLYNGARASRASRTTKSDKKVTVVPGDSIVKNLHGWRLSDTNTESSRCKEVCRRYHWRYGGLPETRDSKTTRAESIILHVRTNDLKNLSPKQVAEGIREFKLRVSGNGKRQVRNFLAKFSLNVFVSYFHSCVERIVIHCSLKTASSFTLYCLIP
jgi:hypothetical protein